MNFFFQRKTADMCEFKKKVLIEPAIDQADHLAQILLV